MAGNGDNDPMDIPDAAPSPYEDKFPYGSGAQAWGDSPNAFGPAEPLPGITSGPAPKPWGLNRDQPTWNQLPAYGPGGRSGGFSGTLDRIRPADPLTDLGMANTAMQQRQFKIPGGGMGRTPPPVPPGLAEIVPSPAPKGEFRVQRWRQGPRPGEDI